VTEDYQEDQTVKYVLKKFTDTNISSFNTSSTTESVYNSRTSTTGSTSNSSSKRKRTTLNTSKSPSPKRRQSSPTRSRVKPEPAWSPPSDSNSYSRPLDSFRDNMEIDQIVPINQHEPVPKASRNSSRTSTSGRDVPGEIKRESQSTRPSSQPTRAPPQTLDDPETYLSNSSKIREEATMIKHSADNNKGLSSREKTVLYLQAGLKYLESNHQHELAMEAFRKIPSENLTIDERKKKQELGAYTLNTYRNIAGFFGQCSKMSSGEKSILGLHLLCEAFAHYKAFQVHKLHHKTTLNEWIGEAKANIMFDHGEKHTNLLRSMQDMIKSVEAWNRANKMGISVLPKGAYSSYSVEDLIAFVNENVI